MKTKNYETILKTICEWPPVHRLRLVQDILKSVLPELATQADDLDSMKSPLGVAESSPPYEIYLPGRHEHRSDFIRQEAEQLLGYLPPQGLAEFAAFIEFLRFKYPIVETPAQDVTDQLSPQAPDEDPILQIIGSADVEPFASEIDKILYGPSQ